MNVTTATFERDVIERSHGSPVTGFVGAHPAAAIGRFLDETIDAQGVTLGAASA